MTNQYFWRMGSVLTNPAESVDVSGPVTDPYVWSLRNPNGTVLAYLTPNGTLSAVGIGTGVTSVLPAAKGDARLITDAAISSGSTTWNSASAGFNSSDPGKTVVIQGAGVAGAPLVTTVQGYLSPTSLRLSAAASTTVSGARAVWGTDDTTAIQGAMNAGGVVRVPPLGYIITAPLQPVNRLTLEADLATFYWAGAANAQMMQAGNGSVVLREFNIRGNFTLDAQNISGVQPFALHSGLFCMFDLLHLVNCPNASACQLVADVPFVLTPPYNQNCAWNQFRMIWVENALNGVLFSGASANQVVTLNHISTIANYNITGYGIAWIGWSDSNVVDMTDTYLSGNGATGVGLNTGGGATPRGIYLNKIGWLGIDAFGLSGCFGITANAAEGPNVVEVLEGSPDPWNGTLVNNPSRYPLITRAGVPSQVADTTLGLAGAVVATAVNYSVSANDETVLATAGAGGISVTLPNANVVVGRLVTVKKVDGGAGAVTVKSAGGTLDGVAAGTGLPIANQFSVLGLRSDGTNWFVVNQKGT